jgi:hypothetical protein
MNRTVRIAALALGALAVAVVGYFVADRFFGGALPDPAAVERRLADMVADGDPLASATRALTADGFECGLVADESGAWHCDLAEGESTDEFDCPMRIMVALIPDDAGRLARFSVAKGEFCM